VNGFQLDYNAAKTFVVDNKIDASSNGRRFAFVEYRELLYGIILILTRKQGKNTLCREKRSTERAQKTKKRGKFGGLKIKPYLCKK